MKLRNKKTGMVADVQGIAIHNMSFDLYDKNNKKLITDVQTIPSYYGSITELNEDWEDYPAEPLIKDEKLRKALWVWADENRIKKVGFKLDKGNTSCACYFYDESCDICEFGLKFYLAIDADKIYTITELCGEEE